MRQRNALTCIKILRSYMYAKYFYLLKCLITYLYKLLLQLRNLKSKPKILLPHPPFHFTSHLESMERKNGITSE